MSRRLMHAAAVAALTVTAVAAGAQVVKEQGSSAAAAKAAINRHWDDVIATFKAGNPAALAALYTTDAMMVAPTMATVTGRVNIEKIFKDWTPTTKFIDMTRKPAALEVYGDIAIENGTNAQTLQEKGKAPMKVEQRYTIVFKKINGKWLVHRDVSTPMPAPAKK